MNEIDENWFLKELNTSLISLEQQLENKVEKKERFPNIFILGLPRSGTTLLSQVIFNNLDIACTNNLIARFWKAPLVGTYLSKIIIGEQKSNEYNSNYGRTSVVESPHEFSYFWRYYLNYTNPFNYKPSKELGKIKWEELKNRICQMNNIIEKPFIFKTLEYTSFFLKQFHTILPKSIFIYIKRNPLEIAKSIYEARIQNENINEWWSSVPLEYGRLKNSDVFDQIAGQIYYLKEQTETSISTIDNNYIIEIDYQDLLNKPLIVLKFIINKVYASSGYKIKAINKPNPFVKRKKDIEKNIEFSLIKSLKKYNLL